MKVIGIMGPLGAGKSTAAKTLIEEFGYRRFSMADPLKAGLRAMGIPVEWETDRALREVPQDLLCGKTWRWAAQSIGTEWGRETIGEDLWVNLTEKKIREYAAVAEAAGVEPCIVFDDIRFPNEVELIRRLGGQVWRITGQNTGVKLPLWKRIAQVFGFKRPHKSEIYWRLVEPDYWIINEFDPDTLAMMVRRGVDGFKS